MNKILILAMAVMCATSVFATYAKSYYHGGHGSHLGGAHYYRRPVHYGGYGHGGYGHVAYAKPVIHHAAYVKPVAHHATYVKPAVHHTTYVKPVAHHYAPVVHAVHSKPAAKIIYSYGPAYHHGGHAVAYKSKYIHHG